MNPEVAHLSLDACCRRIGTNARKCFPRRSLPVLQTLGHNPHKIYQWVHDNIYYVPTQGSVQGAQDTLDKKSGNAVDTASLLIALLRASNIPARYAKWTSPPPRP